MINRSIVSMPTTWLAVLIGCVACQRNAAIETTPSEDSFTTTGLAEKPYDYAAVRQMFISKDTHGLKRISAQSLVDLINNGALDQVREVWERGVDAIPGLDEEFISRKSVRAVMAHVLALASSNRMLNIEIGPMREALREGLDDGDTQVVIISLAGLGAIGDDSDVDRMVKIARENSAKFSRAALGELAAMCSVYAKEGYFGLAAALNNTMPDDEAERIYQSLEKVRRIRCR